MKKLPCWLHFAIPSFLICLGLILNGYAAIQLAKQRPSEFYPRPTPTISSSAGSKQPLVPSPISSKASPLRAAQGEPSFGHLPYLEGKPENMMIISSYAQEKNQRFEKLMPEAALALLKLIYTARDEGIWILPVSGFRSITKQEELFQAQIQKLGTAEAAARVSAPPGYSEHHTGYAIDLADGHYPKTDITQEFLGTETFKWLIRHAIEFGFEMSFPENNPQGVSYEPWHWRFVGSPSAQLVFRRMQ